MTKKMQNLLNKYERRLDTVVTTFNLGYYTFEEAQKEIYKLCNDFDVMRTQMFHYSLISEKDFLETSCLAYNLASKKMDDIIYKSNF